MHHKFDLDQLVVLKQYEWRDKYNAVSIDHLREGFVDESKGIEIFISAAAADTGIDVDLSNVLTLAETPLGGYKLWGPVLMRDGDNLVIKTGNNIFPVTQNGKTFTCGSLSGKFAAAGTKIKIDGVDIVRPILQFEIETPTEDHSFDVRLMFDRECDNEEHRITDDEIKSICKTDSIAPFLAAVKRGSGNVELAKALNYPTYNVAQLLEGTYAIESLIKSPPSKGYEQFGNSYMAVVEIQGDKTTVKLNNAGIKKFLDKCYDAIKQSLVDGGLCYLDVSGVREWSKTFAGSDGVPHTETGLTCDATIRKGAVPMTQKVLSAGSNNSYVAQVKTFHGQLAEPEPANLGKQIPPEEWRRRFGNKTLGKYEEQDDDVIPVRRKYEEEDDSYGQDLRTPVIPWDQLPPTKNQNRLYDTL